MTTVYLTGFMGSGKSTVGPLVAARLGVPFADLDARIEAVAGQPIPALFADEGEAGFRAREAAALRGTAGFGGVVALGGGALVDDANRAWAKAHGCVVYLRASPTALAARLAATAAGRPLLHDAAGQPLPPDRLRARVARLLAARAATYADAHRTVRADALPSVVASRVVGAVRAWQRSPREAT
jgi:shikimate kinase